MGGRIMNGLIAAAGSWLVLTAQLDTGTMHYTTSYPTQKQCIASMAHSEPPEAYYHVRQCIQLKDNLYESYPQSNIKPAKY